MMKQAVLAVAAVLALSDVAAQAVIVTGSQGRNTSAPTGALLNSGWQLQGSFSAYGAGNINGEFLGTPVSSRYFLTAAHFEGGGNNTTITTPDGVVHNLTGNSTQIAGTDFVLREVTAATPFTSVATLFNPAVDAPLTASDTLVTYGRGNARGAAVTGKGWEWATRDGVKSWGTNTFDGLSTVTASDVANGSPFAVGTQFLRADFDLNSDGNEGTLTDGDSGGGVFVQRGGVWKLVGINYGVNLFRASPSASAAAVAAYEANGLYEQLTVNPATFSLVAGSRTQTWDASYVGGSFAAITAATPEPSLLGLAAVGAVGLLRRTRR